MCRSKKLLCEHHVAQALNRLSGGPTVLLSWEIEDFCTENYSTYVTRVRCRAYTKGRSLQEISFIVKINPCKSLEFFNSFVNELFVRESNFLICVTPQINVLLNSFGLESLRVPRCLLQTCEFGKELIIEEDLETRGFGMCQLKQGLDYMHAKLVFQELATLHAASALLQEEYKPLDFLKDEWLQGTKRRHFAMYFEEKVDTALAVLRALSHLQKTRKFLKKLRPNILRTFEEQLKVEDDRFKVICHGDPWSNNFLFRYSSSENESPLNPTEVALLDLQFCRWASLATDLTYFAYTSLSGPTRRYALRELLKSYYTKFSSILRLAGHSPWYSFEELTEEFKKKSLFGLIAALYTVPLALAEKNLEVDGRSKAEFKKSLTERKKKAIDILQGSPYYQSRYLSVFEDLEASGVIK